MYRAKDYGLPVAIVSGILFYRYIAALAGLVSYLIILMLFFTFVKLSIREVRITPVHLLILAIQIGLGLGSYFLLRLLPIENNRVLAEGAMMCFLCPVASASPVVVGILGGSVGVATAYVLLGSLSISIVGPTILGWLGERKESFFWAFMHIFQGVTPLVVIPLLLGLVVRRFMPRTRALIGRLPSAAFWVWVFTLSIVIATTVQFMVSKGASEIPVMLALGALSLVCCATQFAIGKWISRLFLHEPITAGQALAQKNSTLGIWLIQTYLNPLASVALAGYSIWQNLFNTLQLIAHSRSERRAQ